MSVKGFQVGNNVEKYDYTELVNKPTKVSDFTNDSGFVNASGAASAAPVQSVNGNTGAVVLTIPSSAADVGAIAAPSSPATGAFLVWSGSAWVAQTLSTWQGGSY